MHGLLRLSTLVAALCAGVILTGHAQGLGSQGLGYWANVGKFTTGLETYRSNHADNVNGVSIGLRAGLNDLSDSVNIGFEAGHSATGASAVRVGRHAGAFAVSPQAVFLGHAAGQYAYDGSGAIAIGWLAGRNDTLNVNHHSFNSVIIGPSAAESGVNNQVSVIIGSTAASDAVSTVSAVIIGAAAGRSINSANDAVIIGYLAGDTATNAEKSVLIGREAGSTLSRHQTLVIEGNPTYGAAGTTGLLYGEFDTRALTVNGSFGLGVMPAKPACAVAYRGVHWYVRGAGGVADTYEVCMKDAANAYGWKVVATP